MQASTVEVPQVPDEMVQILNEFGNVLKKKNLGSIVSEIVTKANSLNILDEDLTHSLALYEHSKFMQRVLANHDIPNKLRLFNFYTYYEELAETKSSDLINLIINFDLTQYSKNMNLAQLEHGFDTVFKLAMINISPDSYYNTVASFCDIARKNTKRNWSPKKISESVQAYYCIITNLEDLIEFPNINEKITERFKKIRELTYQNLICIYLDGYNFSSNSVKILIDAKNNKISIDDVFYPRKYYTIDTKRK